jgi:hypothetical protein
VGKKHLAHRLGYEEERSSSKQYLELVDEGICCKETCAIFFTASDGEMRWNKTAFADSLKASKHSSWQSHSSGRDGLLSTRQQSCNSSSKGKIKSKRANLQTIRFLVSTMSSPATFVMLKGATRNHTMFIPFDMAFNNDDLTNIAFQNLMMKAA